MFLIFFFQTTKKRKFKPNQSIEDTSKVFDENLSLVNLFPCSSQPKHVRKSHSDSNIIRRSTEGTEPNVEKFSLVNSQQPCSQNLTAINKKLMKMDTVMKPTSKSTIVSSVQHNIFNFPSIRTDLSPTFQNIHVPMFGFSVPPILPTSPVIVPNPISSIHSNPKSQSIFLNEPIEVSSDESIKSGGYMEIESTPVQSTFRKEILGNKSLSESPSSSNKKKKMSKKHKKNKKENEYKFEKNKKRKRKNKDLFEEDTYLQRDKIKRDKKKDKRNKKVKLEEEITLSASSTNSDINTGLFIPPTQIVQTEDKNPIENGIPIPKLTLKIGSLVSSPEKNESNDLPIEDPKTVECVKIDGNSSPELAKISALITHAPKIKTTDNFNNVTTTAALIPDITSGVESLNASNVSAMDVTTSSIDSLFMSPKPGKVMPVPPADTSNQKFPIPSSAVAPSPTESNRPSSYIDEEGNEVWICPACGRVDDGTPMIGCDGCDAWYHWICVGIKEPPNKSDDWFCRVCILKNREDNFSIPYGERKKKSKKKKRSID